MVSGREKAAGKDPGLGSDELEEYPEILPADEPHTYVGFDPAAPGAGLTVFTAWSADELKALEASRNINLYGAEKTRRRAALKRLFDPLLRRARR